MDPAPSSLALALGRIPTGLYVVTTRGAAAPLGFVGSFLMQVGFQPPTLLVAIARDREHLGAIRSSGRFAVSVIEQSGQGLMGPFFRHHAPGNSPFDHVAHHLTPGGLPVLDEALAWLECRVSGEHASGDHVVVFGIVEQGELLRAGDPAIHLRKNGLAY